MPASCHQFWRKQVAPFPFIEIPTWYHNMLLQRLWTLEKLCKFFNTNSMHRLQSVNANLSNPISINPRHDVSNTLTYLASHDGQPICLQFFMTAIHIVCRTHVAVFKHYFPNIAPSILSKVCTKCTHSRGITLSLHTYKCLWLIFSSYSPPRISVLEVQNVAIEYY